MLSRARRIAGAGEAAPFEWGSRTGARPDGPGIGTGLTPHAGDRGPDAQPRAAALEREAFATAYAQGERAGLEAGAMRADAMLRRMADTLQQLDELRRSIVQQTEHEVVQLAVSIARRILVREVSVDQDLLCAMARVALDRLGDSAPAKVRLNPDDHAAIIGKNGAAWAGNHVTIEADPTMSRGGCLVESPFGFIDASVDAQLRVIETALTSDAAMETQAGGHRAR